MNPEHKPPPQPATRKNKKDPFGPPLDASELRGLFRRLHTRSHDEQMAFIQRLNWNLLDAGSERRTIETLLHFLGSTDTALQNHALQILKKLFHNRRGRYAPLFAAALPSLDVPLQLRLQEIFGPVLGKTPPPAKPKDTAPPKSASDEDLQRLQAFFKRKT